MTRIVLSIGEDNSTVTLRGSYHYLICVAKENVRLAISDDDCAVQVKDKIDAIDDYFVKAAE